MIKANGISKSYFSSSKKLTAVDDVTLTVNDGEILGFLGLNGAGKTTTIKILAGLIEPDKGKVTIGGEDIHGNCKLGVLLDGHRNLYWRLTSVENIEYFGILRGLKRRDAKQRSTELIRMFGLDEKKDVHVQKLSRGMQQRLAICVAIAHRPSALLLDEPTMGVDYENTERLRLAINQLRNEGTSILLTTHQLAIAESFSDRVAIIREGKIVVDDIEPSASRIKLNRKYKLILEEELKDVIEGALLKLDLKINGREISDVGSEDLYRVLDIVKPNVIEKLESVESNFEELFIQYARG